LTFRYAELRCKSNFSFLEGASHPEELVDRAAGLGLEALALTDRNGLYGVVRAHARARKRGLPLLVGAEMTCDGLGPRGAATLILLAADRDGYAHLCRLVTEAHRGDPIEVAGAVDAVARPPEARVPFLRVADLARGLVALYPGADADSAARLRGSSDAASPWRYPAIAPPGRRPASPPRAAWGGAWAFRWRW